MLNKKTLNVIPEKEQLYRTYAVIIKSGWCVTLKKIVTAFIVSQSITVPYKKNVLGCVSLIIITHPFYY